MVEHNDLKIAKLLNFTNFAWKWKPVTGCFNCIEEEKTF